MTENKITKPDSDFSRYENKQALHEESLKAGKDIYIKGETKNGKIKKG